MKKIILTLSIAAVLFSCKKKEEDTTPAIANQETSLRVNFKVGDKDFLFNTAFSSDSAKFTVNSYRFYLSKISLVKNDGSEVPFTDKYLLVNPNTQDYVLGTVSVGDYKGIKFNVGIDSATNHKDPSLYAIYHPLAIQSPGIHWSWNSGYIFNMIEGSVDTTAAQNDPLVYGSYAKSMFFHVGMDALLRKIEITKPISITTENKGIISLEVDIAKLIAGVNLKKENQSHTMGSMMLATKIADNSKNMFTIK